MVQLVAKTNSLTIVIVLYLQVFTSPFHRYYQHCTNCEKLHQNHTRGQPNKHNQTGLKFNNPDYKFAGETIIVSDSDVQDVKRNLTYCDKISQSLFNNYSLQCIDYHLCSTIEAEPSEKVRRLSCGLKLDGSIKVCCKSSSAGILSRKDRVEDENDDDTEDDNAPLGRLLPNREGSNETLVVTDELQPVTDRSASGRTSRNRDDKREQSFPKECGLVTDKNNNTNNEPDGLIDAIRIIGGDNARRNAWPWFALVLVQRRSNSRKSPECGGTLISDRFILTAAHCVLEQSKRTIKKSRLTVRLGEFDLRKPDDGEVDIGVERVIVHPHFQPNTFKNDIALIELKREVNFA